MSRQPSTFSVSLCRRACAFNKALFKIASFIIFSNRGICCDEYLVRVRVAVSSFVWDLCQMREGTATRKCPQGSDLSPVLAWIAHHGLVFRGI